MPTNITIVYEGYKRFKNVIIRTEVSSQLNIEILHLEMHIFSQIRFKKSLSFPMFFFLSLMTQFKAYGPYDMDYAWLFITITVSKLI